MAKGGAEWQARSEEGRREKLAEIERLQVLVAMLEWERQRLGGSLGFALKQEEWAGAGPKLAEVGANDDADEVADAASSAIVLVHAPSPSRAPSARGGEIADPALVEVGACIMSPAPALMPS